MPADLSASVQEQARRRRRDPDQLHQRRWVEDGDLATSAGSPPGSTWPCISPLA
ncbi:MULTISPECIES: hypothetical protein [unclassified Blastococcus]